MTTNAHSEAVKRWLEDHFDVKILAFSCLSDQGGNHLYKAVLSDKSASCFRLLPYDEAKWQLFSILKDCQYDTIVSIEALKVIDRLLVVKEGFCEGVALDQCIGEMIDQPVEIERFFISFAGLLIDLERLYESYGLLHLDIKPEHLLKTQSGGLKLIDFGAGYTQIERTNLKKHLQQGSSAYICQSRLLDFNAVGPHVDLYALLISFRECLHLAQFENVIVLLGIDQMIQELNAMTISHKDIYKRIRDQWIAIYMNQYGHITNR